MELEFHSMKRKQLQALCKERGIPANLTNLEMANRLSLLLKESENSDASELSSSSKLVVEVSNGIDSAVAPRKTKKVRFSPENETFIFIRSEAKDTTIRKQLRRRTFKKNLQELSVHVTSEAESSAPKKQKVGGRRISTRSKSSGSEVISINSEAESSSPKKFTGKRRLNKKSNPSTSVDTENVYVIEKPPPVVETTRWNLRSRGFAGKKRNGVDDEKVEASKQSVPVKQQGRVTRQAKRQLNDNFTMQHGEEGAESERIKVFNGQTIEVVPEIIEGRKSIDRKNNLPREEEIKVPSGLQDKEAIPRTSRRKSVRLHASDLQEPVMKANELQNHLPLRRSLRCASKRQSFVQKTSVSDAKAKNQRSSRVRPLAKETPETESLAAANETSEHVLDFTATNDREAEAPVTESLGVESSAEVEKERLDLVDDKVNDGSSAVSHKGAIPRTSRRRNFRANDSQEPVIKENEFQTQFSLIRSSRCASNSVSVAQAKKQKTSGLLSLAKETSETESLAGANEASEHFVDFTATTHREAKAPVAESAGVENLAEVEIVELVADKVNNGSNAVSHKPASLTSYLVRKDVFLNLDTVRDSETQLSSEQKMCSIVEELLCADRMDNSNDNKETAAVQVNISGSPVAATNGIKNKEFNEFQNQRTAKPSLPIAPTSLRDQEILFVVEEQCSEQSYSRIADSDENAEQDETSEIEKSPKHSEVSVIVSESLQDEVVCLISGEEKHEDLERYVDYAPQGHTLGLREYTTESLAKEIKPGNMTALDANKSGILKNLDATESLESEGVSVSGDSISLDTTFEDKVLPSDAKRNGKKNEEDKKPRDNEHDNGVVFKNAERCTSIENSQSRVRVEDEEYNVLEKRSSYSLEQRPLDEEENAPILSLQSPHNVLDERFTFYEFPVLKDDDEIKGLSSAAYEAGSKLLDYECENNALEKDTQEDSHIALASNTCENQNDVSFDEENEVPTTARTALANTATDRVGCIMIPPEGSTSGNTCSPQHLESMRFRQGGELIKNTVSDDAIIALTSSSQVEASLELNAEGETFASEDHRTPSLFSVECAPEVDIEKNPTAELDGFPQELVLEQVDGAVSDSAAILEGFKETVLLPFKICNDESSQETVPECNHQHMLESEMQFVIELANKCPADMSPLQVLISTPLLNNGCKSGDTILREDYSSFNNSECANNAIDKGILEDSHIPLASDTSEIQNDVVLDEDNGMPTAARIARASIVPNVEGSMPDETCSSQLLESLEGRDGGELVMNIVSDNATNVCTSLEENAEGESYARDDSPDSSIPSLHMEGCVLEANTMKEIAAAKLDVEDCAGSKYCDQCDEGSEKMGSEATVVDEDFKHTLLPLKSCNNVSSPEIVFATPVVFNKRETHTETETEVETKISSLDDQNDKTVAIFEEESSGRIRDGAELVKQCPFYMSPLKMLNSPQLLNNDGNYCGTNPRGQNSSFRLEQLFKASSVKTKTNNDAEVDADGSRGRADVDADGSRGRADVEGKSCHSNSVNGSVSMMNDSATNGERYNDLNLEQHDCVYQNQGSGKEIDCLLQISAPALGSEHMCVEREETAVFQECHSQNSIDCSSQEEIVVTMFNVMQPNAAEAYAGESIDEKTTADAKLEDEENYDEYSEISPDSCAADNIIDEGPQTESHMQLTLPELRTREGEADFHIVPDSGELYTERSKMIADVNGDDDMDAARATSLEVTTSLVKGSECLLQIHEIIPESETLCVERGETGTAQECCGRDSAKLDADEDTDEMEVKISIQDTAVSSIISGNDAVESLEIQNNFGLDSSDRSLSSHINDFLEGESEVLTEWEMRLFSSGVPKKLEKDTSGSQQKLETERSSHGTEMIGDLIEMTDAEVFTELEIRLLSAEFTGTGQVDENTDLPESIGDLVASMDSVVANEDPKADEVSNLESSGHAICNEDSVNAIKILSNTNREDDSTMVKECSDCDNEDISCKYSRMVECPASSDSAMKIDSRASQEKLRLSNHMISFPLGRTEGRLHAIAVTPKKPMNMLDMKENVVSSKGDQQLGGLTATKSVRKRQPLKDLQQKLI